MTNFLNSEYYLTFDDVLLKPKYSDLIPAEANTKTRLTKNIELNIPLLSAAMDTVTESAMAIAMAQNGGLGIIHKNMSVENQAREVKIVKRFESGVVVEPTTMYKDATLGEALELMSKQKLSGIPIVDKKTNKLVGILTNRDVRFAEDKSQPISKLMTKDNLITSKPNISREDAIRLLHKHRIERIILVDDDYHCVGLMTFKDIKKSQEYPFATKDEQGRLRVGAATGVGEKGYERAIALIEAGVDVIVVDTAHGHSKGVLDTIKKLRKEYPKLDIIGGNIATKEAAKALINAGVSAVKVGIGPGSICTTRVIAGVGVPQLSAVYEVVQACEKDKIPVIADGGIRYSGDFAKAIAIGASCIMCGSILAGTDEAPGDIVLYQSRSYKVYRGMGSLEAMQKGSADRYFQDSKDKQKLVPEGVEGRVAYKGSVSEVIYQMVGGLKASMGYTGNRTIAEMRKNCEFIKITNSALKESHPHNIKITNEAPNYTTGV
jgi:IMP dehydrogenase